jgi:hypothetical protein
MSNSNNAQLPSKPKLLQLQDALNLYGRHLDWCQKLAQMPTEPGRTYIHPTDWDNWRAKQPCTCKWEEAINALVRPSDETPATPCSICDKGPHEFESWQGQPPHTYSPRQPAQQMEAHPQIPILNGEVVPEKPTTPAGPEHRWHFVDGTRQEVAHQIQRWGTVHDRAKEPQDWFWLVGYLAGKALKAHIDGDVNKALHHTISSAAVLANWHAQIKLGHAGRFTPGSSDLQKMLEETFGAAVPTVSEEVSHGK